ncbi:MAG TPA: glycosyltransferase family 2 protein [bacterium]|nr:glycosyltransferase family 2 protein [bacterium]
MHDSLILIPAFNAEDTLRGVLDSVKPFCENVLVVNDGSIDKTADVVRSCSWVRLCEHERNKGKGAALATGMTLAKQLGYRTVITMDADGQHCPSEIPGFLQEYAQTGSHIIVGSRFHENSHSEDSVPLVRLISNRLSSALLSWRIGSRITDGQSGFRLYDLSVADLFEGLNPGFVWETQILVRAAQSGLKIAEIPITRRYPDGTKTSHYRSIRDSAQIIKAIFSKH